MPTEQNYDFLHRLRTIYTPNRRNPNAQPAEDEVQLHENWTIAIPRDATKLVRDAAADLQSYLRISMNLSLTIEETAKPSPKSIVLIPNIKNLGRRGTINLEVSEKAVRLQGTDDRAIRHGVVRLEDIMSLREAPFLPKGKQLRQPLTRMRSVHSGAGIDQYPDWQLDAILHAGFNAIDLFIKAPDLTAAGPQHVNDIIKRAAEYGLDVVLYSYLQSFKHPDDPDAEAFFDSVYGEIIRRHPGAKAIHLVGESLQFPSKDPHTSGKRASESVVDGIPDTKPGPGWYPCYDYPAYLNCIRRAIRKVSPDVEIIFNTYNWGWTPLEARRKFLEQLPEDVTLQATYDIFKQNDFHGLQHPTMDYSISAADPGFYFSSEVKTAHELGIKRIRVTSNLAGASWDFGTVPYAPVPQRWAHRMKVLKDYAMNYGVTSFYDNHHYGWWPNPCNDLAKEIFNTEEDVDVNALLLKVAARDYGQEVAKDIVKAWDLWSTAMDHYVGTNEDQYGPWRTGPSYPFIFQPNISRTMSDKEIQFPTAPHAHFGYHIIKTFYTPYENDCQSPGPLRMPLEIKELEKMLKLWNKGLDLVANALAKVPQNKRDNAVRLFALGKFIRNSIITTTHIKQWWILNIKLQVPSTKKNMLAIMDQLAQLAEDEIANVKDTVDAVKSDSRIGWEPSMEYVCDEWHLNWKLRQMESAKRELATYRQIILL